MQGIYQITNNLNHKTYIGQSKNIEQRWKAHRRNAFNPVMLSTCPKLYKEVQKIGWDVFSFRVLEEIDNQSLLTPREIYWINYYDSVRNGYNSSIPDMTGELNVRSKLHINEVIQIQQALLHTDITIEKLATQYNVQVSTIYRINKGETWVDTSLKYPLRSWNYEARHGSQNGQSIFSEEEVLHLRQRYVTETVNSIYQDYQDRCSLSGFKKIIQGGTFKNVPIYKKKEKRWIS